MFFLLGWGGVGDEETKALEKALDSQSGALVFLKTAGESALCL